MNRSTPGITGGGSGSGSGSASASAYGSYVAVSGKKWTRPTLSLCLSNQHCTENTFPCKCPQIVADRNGSGNRGNVDAAGGMSRILTGPQIIFMLIVRNI